MPMPFKIKCQYCGNIYHANKKKRSHCRRSDCRDKEIKNQLMQLQTTLELLCNNKIESKIEVRLAGNDKISHEAKIDSISDLREVCNIDDYNIAADSDANDTAHDGCGGINLIKLIPYFRVLLWKGVKGNFIIETYGDGTINPKILNQTFSPLSMPLIIGNNLLVCGYGEENKRPL